MNNLCRLVKYVIVLLLLVLSFPSAKADSKKAWQALEKLDIETAKTLFEKELKKSPNDFSALRGMLITSYFDLDYPKQIETIDKIIEVAPGDPYLVPIYEFVAAELTDWAERTDLKYKIGQSLAENATGSLAHTGQLIIEDYYRQSQCRLPEGWHTMMAYAPGCWICGLFENRSNIAAYRPVEFEGMQLDTLATTTGKTGSKVGWTWLPNGKFGNFSPYITVENTTDVAFQARFFIELPEEKEILVLMGGAINYRILFDGVKVHDDPHYRNAVQREGFRIKASKGVHEITVVMGTTDTGITYGLEVLDTNYKPIEGLKWHRYANVPHGSTFDVETFHPIFQPFEKYIAEKGEMPDTRFWRTFLQIYNGYSDEAVSNLEKLYGENKLSSMDVYALFKALEINDELLLGLRYLSTLLEDARVPMIDYIWIDNTVDNYEVQINNFCSLDSLYPNRFPLEMTSLLKPILSQDMKGLFDNFNRLLLKYPNAVGIHTFLAMMYGQTVGDSEASYREARLYAEKTKDNYLLLTAEPHYLMGMGKYDEAIAKAKELVETIEYSDANLAGLFLAYSAVNREKEMVPLLDSLKERFPYNVELYSRLYDIYSKTGDYDKANTMLATIHQLKPSAIIPYQILDSLHNNVPYDSIFGSVDVMKLWGDTPPETQRGNQNYWYIIDKRQSLLFESGVVLRDVHFAIGLIDQEAVEQYQEMYLGFDSENWYNKLLVAQRLRKGEPPLPGNIEQEYAVFQDLKPGDVIEIHYRSWESRDGDLWQEFWDTYQAYGNFYQDNWEYAIITNRDDLRYVTSKPAPKPKVSDHCGFKKYSWSGKKSLAMDFDLAMLPPLADISGEVFVTTIDNWDTINHWYYSVSEAVLGENPRSKTLADSLTTQNMTDYQKLEKLFNYIVLEIPYQTIGFDYHASIPRKPDDVLINRWGDCKDKGHLLIQMLRHVGIDAWPILVKTRDLGAQMPLPYFGFNHLITGCIIDDDTVFVDVTDIPVPPTCSITNDVAGQPALQIHAGKSHRELSRLPQIDFNDTRWDMALVLEHESGNSYTFEYARSYYNLEAGFSRYNLRGYSMDELRKDIESSYADNWAIILTVDSVVIDELGTTDSIFTEKLYGKMELTSQTIGNTTIVNLPKWLTISKALVSLLGDPVKRTQPVDRFTYCGRFNKTLEFHVPEEYGKPQPLDKADIGKLPLHFMYDYNWDEKERILTLSYKLEVEPGESKPAEFVNFAKKVIEVFDSPLLFQKQ